MPWIKKETCTACGVCIESCTAGAIQMDDEAAFINDSKCIRCGVCHDVCPSDSIRHDSELIPAEVESNIAWVMQLLENDYYKDNSVKQKELLLRVERYFNKVKVVAEKTIERIRVIQNG